jgi:hypothetical protein
VDDPSSTSYERKNAQALLEKMEKRYQRHRDEKQGLGEA